MWFIGIPACMAVAAVYVYNDEFLALRKAVKDGMYTPGPYVITRLLLEPFFMLGQRSVSLSTPKWPLLAGSPAKA